MKYLSSVGLGLSIVFGCLLLALVAELYYLLCWKNKKKRLTTSRDIENDYTSNPAAGELSFFMFCWKTSASMAQSALNPQEIRLSEDQEQRQQVHHHHHLQSNKDLLVKQFGDHDDHGGSLGNELMRLQCLSAGPPRFLFTIVEETMEDLDSEEVKSKSRVGSRGRSLSDLLLTVETPFLTPLASPPFFTPPLTPLEACCSQQGGFIPLFETATDAEFYRIKSSSSSSPSSSTSSPPPKFKFLQEAEEKLHKKTLMEEEVHSNNDDGFDGGKLKDEEEDGSFITIHC